MSILITFGEEEEKENSINTPSSTHNNSSKEEFNNNDSYLTQEEESPIIIPQKKIEKIQNQQQKPIELSTQQEDNKKNVEQEIIDNQKLFPSNIYTKSNQEGDTREDPKAGSNQGSIYSTSKEGTIYEGGNSYYLEGRLLIGELPKPKHPGNQSGKVVVKIYVDRNGNVLKAEPGQKGTTITDPEYLKAAKVAALQAKFEPKNIAPEIQEGKIIYVFRLR